MTENLLVGVEQHQKLFTPEENAHFERSKLVEKFVQRRKAASPKTAVNYRSRIRNFCQFAYKQHAKIELDDFINEIKADKLDVYEVLADFAAWLVNERTGQSEIRARSVKAIVITVKKFLRVSGCKIDTDTFKDQISFARIERQDYQALDRQDVACYLNACKDMRLKTSIMLFAGLGCRALEGCAIRLQDVDLKANPPTITIQAKYSKMRQARTRPITAELANQIRMWLKVKYAPHRSAIPQTDKTMNYVDVEPEQKADDLLLAKFHLNGVQPQPINLYYVVRKEFVQLLTLVDAAKTEGRRHAITLNSFRRFAKTTISDVAGYDYSEWFIGHAGSTYWRKKIEERNEAFGRCEPHLSFIDFKQLESLVDELRDRDTKEDVIRTLSDHLTMVIEQNKRLEERLTELEKQKLQPEKITIEARQL
jgi:integrase